MTPKPALTIVIPTYDEADIIESSMRVIVGEIGDLRPNTEIIIVDDGTDDLPHVVTRIAPSLGLLGIRVVRNEHREGKGPSVARALAAADGAIVGFVDVDLSVAPSHIREAIEVINAGSDICIATRVGNRFTSGETFMTSMAATAFRYVHGTFIFDHGKAIPDTQCGFKFFRQAVARDLFRNLVATDGLFDLEVLLKATRADYRIAQIEVPRKIDRIGKRPLKKIMVNETRSLWQIFKRYRLTKV